MAINTCKHLWRTAYNNYCQGQLKKERHGAGLEDQMLQLLGHFKLVRLAETFDKKC